MNSLRTLCRPLALSLLLAGASLGSGCGFGCAAIVLPALQVTVTDATTAKRICNAVVTAQNGSSNVTLMAQGSGPDDCTYTGGENSGTYQVTVTSTGFQTASERGVQVTSDVCGVETTMITIALSH